METLYRGGNVGNQTVTGVLTKLSTVTKVEDRPIYGRDLKSALGILNMTVLYKKKHNQSSATVEKARKSFMDVASNLLDPLNAEIWQGLGKVKFDTQNI